MALWIWRTTITHTDSNVQKMIVTLVNLPVTLSRYNHQRFTRFMRLFSINSTMFEALFMRSQS